MAKITCSQCGRRTGSFSHLEKDAEGHNSKPVCDPCLVFLKALALAK